MIGVVTAVIGLAIQTGGIPIERTVAIVGGQAITMTDAQTAMVLGLVDASGDLTTAIERLVERTLILREVERYTPVEPTEARIDQRLDQLRGQVSASQWERTLAAGGFSEARLRGWLRDDLRITTYLDQRFSVTGGTGQSREELIADWLSDLRRRTVVVELWKVSPTPP